ncbi:SNF2-related protein, partial [Vibrio genomosp. F10]|uniref:SNF2-related protein n=1 Tax=Vibrio genomosp. F10 TaxID=723171 RepID=UPI000A5BF458
YSMETTNTDFFAFQYKPVLSFLEAPSKGILIADEVGLGKTIEAGLIWTELRARMDARRLMILCPAMLREKWKYELMHRFGIDADLMNAEDLLHELKKDKKQVATGKAI